MPARVGLTVPLSDGLEALNLAVRMTGVGRRPQFAASGSSRWSKARRGCPHHAGIRRQPGATARHAADDLALL